MSTRHDMWTPKEDKYLAETVISYVGGDKNLKEAFIRVANDINRSETAVRYRWNAEVKYTYKEGLILNKNTIKKLYFMSKQKTVEPPSNLSISDLIYYLKNLSCIMDEIKSENMQLKKENLALKKENEDYKAKLQQFNEIMTIVNQFKKIS